MQVVILAAGQSSRFYPFSNFVHKSLVKVLGKTVIEHTIESIRSSGIKDVVIVTANNSAIKDVLGDGGRYGVHITYAVQEEPLGMGDALLAAKELIHDEFFLLNSQHVNFADFKHLLEKKKQHRDSLVLLSKKGDQLHKFGFLKVEGDRVLEFIEKPTAEMAPSDFRVVGIYLLNKKFFETLEKTNLGHDSLEEAISTYARASEVTMAVTEEQTVSLKYPWDLFALSSFLLERTKSSIAKNASIAKTVTIEGHVVIEDGVKIMEGASIKGPCYIGANSFIGHNAIVRDGVIVGEGVVIGANLEVKHSFIMDGTTTHFGFIGDSIIGRSCRIAGNITTGNVRLDRESIHVTLRDKKIDTHLRALGVIMGDEVVTGICMATMPGIVIGKKTIIGPSTTVMENLEEEITYYTEFKTVRKNRD